MSKSIVVTRLFAEPVCLGARADSFRALLNRAARKLARASKRAPVDVEIYHGAEDLATLATAQVLELAFSGSALAFQILEVNPDARVIRLRILPADERSDSPFEAFYERATLELAGSPAYHVEWRTV